MIANLKSDWRFWTAGGVILLVTLLLGVRTQKSVAAVLSTREQTLPTVAWNGGVTPGEDAAYERRQAALQLVDHSLRDPFRPLPVAAPPDPPQKKSKPTRTPYWATIPSPHAIMFDGENSAAQIRIGKRLSDWLRVGDEWQDWKIIEIKSDCIRVARGDEIYVMRAF